MKVYIVDIQRISMEKETLFSMLSKKYQNSPFLFTIQTIDRKNFLAGIYQSHAYTDEPVPIANFQKTQSYSAMIEMAELLNLNSSDDILEIGTGSGYFSAILFQHTKTLVTIERIRKLCGFAQNNLKKQFPDAMANKEIQIKYENASQIQNIFQENSFSKIVFTCEIDIHKTDINTITPLLKKNGLLVIPTKDKLLQYTRNNAGKAFLLDEKEHSFEFCKYKSKKE